MGVSFSWQPINGKNIPVGARSQFAKILGEAFGTYPWILDESNLVELNAIRIGAEDEGIKKALAIIIEAIQEHGRISVMAEY